MMCSPIILFVFNRPDHTYETLEALMKNELASESEIHIYADGMRHEGDIPGVKEVRRLIHAPLSFKKVHIIERDENFGLARNVIEGVSEVIEQYGSAIVVEDDIVTSKFFLRFMNETLKLYKDRKDIFSISGFNLPDNLMTIPQDYEKGVYLNYRNSSWGWATWSDRWKLVDWEVKGFDQFKRSRKKQKQFNRAGDDMSDMLKAQQQGVINSWWIRFYNCHFDNNAYAVYPVKSFINNIGHDGSGVHCDETDKYFNPIDVGEWNLELSQDIAMDPRLVAAHNFAFRYTTFFRIKKVLHTNLPPVIWKFGASIFKSISKIF